MKQLQEPGDRSPAPGSLRLVQLFVNTDDLETGPDLLADAAALSDWLNERGSWPPTSRSATTSMRERSSFARRSASSRPLTPGCRTTRRRQTSSTPRGGARLRPVLDDPATRFEPADGGVDGALGRIVAGIHAGIAEGTWKRLKACERDDCRWAFYDHSKNQSGHWCSMAGCGQREKNRRAYRRRRSRAARDVRSSRGSAASRRSSAPAIASRIGPSSKRSTSSCMKPSITSRVATGSPSPRERR